MTKNKLTFSCQNIQSIAQFHTEIAKFLDFPDFYGKNWDAFWDAITGLVEMPATLQITHTAVLEKISSKNFAVFYEIVEEFNALSYNNSRIEYD